MPYRWITWRALVQSTRQTPAKRDSNIPDREMDPWRRSYAPLHAHVYIVCPVSVWAHYSQIVIVLKWACAEELPLLFDLPGIPWLKVHVAFVFSVCFGYKYWRFPCLAPKSLVPVHVAALKEEIAGRLKLPTVWIRCNWGTGVTYMLTTNKPL